MGGSRLCAFPLPPAPAGDSHLLLLANMSDIGAQLALLASESTDQKTRIDKYKAMLASLAAAGDAASLRQYM